MWRAGLFHSIKCRYYQTFTPALERIPAAILKYSLLVREHPVETGLISGRHVCKKCTTEFCTSTSLQVNISAIDEWHYIQSEFFAWEVMEMREVHFTRCQWGSQLQNLLTYVRFMIKQLLWPPKVAQHNIQNGNLIMVTKERSPHWICSWCQEANWGVSDCN